MTVLLASAAAVGFIAGGIINANAEKEEKESREASAVAHGGNISASDSDSGEVATGDCKICWEQPVAVLFLPCKHASCCCRCASRVTNCPTCRQVIRNKERIFL
eukprot:Filipodium_phascolosomae@DN8371_c0_g1_i1.p2